MAYFVISGDLAGLGCHLLERPAVGIVDVSDGWKLKPGESAQIRQIVSIEVEVIKTSGGENARQQHVTNEKTNEAALPFDPSHPGPSYFPNRSAGAHSHTLEADSQRHRDGPSWRWSRYAHREVAFADRFNLAIRGARPSAGSIVRASAGTGLYRL
jgi:hypothetical protein